MNIDPSKLEMLQEAARQAVDAAYVPYSRFPVGAAVLTSSGAVFSACNVENASYGLSMCAERSAIFKMISEREQDVVAVAVFTPTSTPSAPCGACRQVISEFGPDAVVMSSCESDQVLLSTIGQLLPDQFGPQNFKKGGEINETGSKKGGLGHT